MTPLMVDAREAARLMGCEKQLIHKLIHKGQLDGVKYDDAPWAKWFVSVESIKAFVAQRRSK